jgi:RND family efflux transporter MFP subunit
MKILFILQFLLILLAFTACKTDYPGQEVTTALADAPVPVEVVSLALSTEIIPIEAGGTIGAKEEAKLSFKIGGIIDQVSAREGQYVRRGTVVARLKTTEVDAQVMKARQAKDKLQRDLERVKKLYAEEAATLEQVEGLTTALEIASSDLEIAGFNQTYAKITAPVSGRIVKRFAERGELIGPGSPVFLMIGEGSGSYVLRVGVADRDVLTLVMGDRAEVRLDAYEGAIVPATITQIAAAADPRTGTFEVELTLDGKGKILKSGFIGRASIFPSRQPAHYRLPLDALVEGKGRNVRIFYPDAEGRAAARMVRFSHLLDDDFVVPERELTGVREVITKGAAYLTEGASIKR